MNNFRGTLAPQRFGPVRLAMAALLATAMLAGGSTDARAAACLEEAFGGGVNCTSNDVAVASISVTMVVDACDGTPGDTFTFDGTLNAELNANTRYDLGFYIGANPESSTNDDCSVTIIPPAVSDVDGDACGDVSTATLNVPVTGLTAPCQDGDGDGFFDVNECSSWDNNAGGTCSGPADAVPGTSSKCNCEVVPTNLPVPNCENTPGICNDNNDCTNDVCDLDGPNTNMFGCRNDNNSAPCDDGLFCTVNDVCSAGECGGDPTPRDCDDSNLCTNDSCDEAADTCVNANNNLPCDDGLFCTVGDVCGGGTCDGAARDCADTNVCTADTCNEDTNACVNANNTVACDDGLFCTVNDTCSAGECVGTTRDCNDSEVCTDDSCNESGDTCVNAANEASCDDGLFCTVGDTCGNGTCNGSARDCADTNVCTDDSCSEASDACVNANNNNPCDDGLFCTVDDVCGGGECGGSARDCADTNVCTDDSCDEAQDTCANANNTAACDDGLFCTVSDICASGQCSGSARDCSDTEFCTNDSCNETTNACVNAPTTTDCSDGNFCTVDDTCASGTCVGTPRNCDDTNVCTNDSCNESTDVCDNVNNTSPCDDGLFCTVSDVCGGGQCGGSARSCDDTNVCTNDSCNEDTNACVNANNTSPCDDGLFCTVSDTCAAGSCTGSARNCADTNVCTADTCNESTNACVNANNAVACDDGLFCTVGDICGGGECNGTARDCADTNSCTNDSCNENTNACVNANNTIACNDGLFCTVDDVCSGGECSGTTRDCTDDIGCTDSSCSESTDSCVQTPDNEDCDDEESCTTDICDINEGCRNVFSCVDICRRFGWWAKRGGDDGDRENFIQQLLDALGGIEVCGQEVTETSLNGSVEGLGLDSALEGLCVRPDSLREKLYRELVAARLNCGMSGNDDCDEVISEFIEVDFSDCDSACEEGFSDDDSFARTCFRQIDCYNSGGSLINGKCAYGECDLTNALCGGDYGACAPFASIPIPVLQTCERFSGSCRDADFCQPSLEICPSRTPVSGSQACKEAKRNECTIDDCSISED